MITRAVQPVATCRQSPYLHKPAIVIMRSRAYGARSPHSHYDVILVMTLFATELAMPTITDVRTYVHTDTLLRLIYKHNNIKHISV